MICKEKFKIHFSSVLLFSTTNTACIVLLWCPHTTLKLKKFEIRNIMDWFRCCLLIPFTLFKDQISYYSFLDLLLIREDFGEKNYGENRMFLVKLSLLQKDGAAIRTHLWCTKVTVLASHLKGAAIPR